MVLFSRLEWATHSNVDESASGAVQKSSAPVYSVDLHPDGSRFATAGGDCRVKVWSTGGVPSSGAAKPKTPPSHQHLLCSRAAHLGPINCLRWSPDGRYLATASDDKTIKVWERLAGSGSVFGGDVSIENWKDIRTLRGHSMNVMGVCWSPDGKMLASCSLDNTLSVWSVEGMEPKLLHTITGHKGLVKGLAWDPVGKYIASQAEDRTVRIWTVGDWAEERVVQAPFKESVATNSVFFTRLDWTPSGSNVITSCGINNGCHTAPALPRGQWEPAKDLVGHSKPVVAVRCSSRIYALDAGAAAAQAYDKLVLIVAIASTDGTLSVWSTSAQRPIAVVSTLFSQCVMDITWSEKQDLLLACSTDGTVGCIRFDEGELGVPLSREQKMDYMKNLYGDLIGTATTSALAETTDQLQLEKEAACEAIDLTASDTGTLPMAAEAGKAAGGVAAAAGSAQATDAAPVFDIESLGSSESCDLLDEEEDEEEDDDEEDDEEDDEDEDMVDVAAAATLGSSGAPPPYAGAPITDQREQVLPGGKRRITPLFLGRPEQLGAAAVPASPFASPALSSASPVAAASPAAPSPTANSTAAAASASAAGAAVGKKRPRATSKASQGEGEEAKGKAKAAKTSAKSTVAKKAPAKKSTTTRVKKEPGQAKKRVTPTLVTDSSATPMQAFRTPRGRPRTPSTATPSARMVAMTVGKEKFLLKEPDTQDSLKFQLPLRQPLLSEAAGTPAVLNTVAAPSSRSGKAGAVLKCSKEGILQWEQFLPAEASILTGNADFCAVSCKNGTIHIFSPSGRRLMPAIALGQPLTELVCNKHGHLVAITCGCLMYVWNILKGSCEVMESVRPVLAGSGDCIRRVTVTQNAVPVIVTGVGSCYTLDPKMRAWLLVADGSFSQSCYHGSVSGSKPGPLATLHQETEKAAGPPSFSNSRQDLESLSHLGYQVAAAKALDSKVEYKHWLITYVRRLSVEAEEGILCEICDELLEPEVSGVAADDASRQVLGLDKRSLLDVVLRTMSTNRKLQRIVNKYRELLKELEASKSSGDNMDVDI